MIGTGSFRKISEYISESFQLGSDSLSFLTNARNILENSNINTEDKNRKKVYSLISATYSNIVLRHVSVSKKYINAVKALNDHVIEKYENSDMDDFLSSQYLEVPEQYAYISGLAGYDISKIGDAAARFIDIEDSLDSIILPFEKIGWENV